jgi:hypothetical protein
VTGGYKIIIIWNVGYIKSKKYPYQIKKYLFIVTCFVGTIEARVFMIGQLRNSLQQPGATNP